MRNAMLFLSLCLALASGAPLSAAEHPEHPKEHPTEHPRAHKGEHPAGHEHPVGSKHWNKQMRKEFNQAVEDHVKRRSVDGAFKVRDEKLGKEWSLKLVRVHKKRIVHLGGSSFFACADFKTTGKGEKAKLDLDFYATKGPDGWKIDRTVIHKVDGKPRYVYNEKNEMVPVRD